MLIDTDTLTALLDTHYDVQPLDDYDCALLVDRLIDALPDGHPDVELTRSGVWRGTLAGWLEVGPGLVQRVPLVRVELTDRKPWLSEEMGYAWWGYSIKLSSLDSRDHPWRLKDTLPQEFFREKSYSNTWHYYKTLELALDDASRRAIAWARSNAKETV